MGEEWGYRGGGSMKRGLGKVRTGMAAFPEELTTEDRAGERGAGDKERGSSQRVSRARELRREGHAGFQLWRTSCGNRRAVWG